MSNTKKRPKGGRKGGSVFPRVKLQKAHEYSKKLVSKTHTGSIAKDLMYPGVFGVTGTTGNAKASALKQYGLLEGTPEEYTASKIARSLNSGTEEEVRDLLASAFLTAPLFKQLFNTFVSDSVSRAKIKSLAGSLKVHPDNLEECVEIFIDSAVYAGLATDNGEAITFHSAPQTSQGAENSLEEEEQEGSDEEGDNPEVPLPLSVDRTPTRTQSSQSKANIDIKIDPSMDPEKLEKQLSLLRKFGLI